MVSTNNDKQKNETRKKNVSFFITDQFMRVIFKLHGINFTTNHHPEF